jgi:hypothetical protein
MISTPYLDPTLFDDPRLDHNRERRQTALKVSFDILANSVTPN